MKGPSNRSTDYANVLHTLIKSVKLLKEATESTNLPLPSGPLARVAIDRLETIKALKANKDVGEELAEKIVHQVGTIYHELARPTANDGDSPGVTRASVVRYTKALTDAHDTLIRLSHRGLLGKSLLRGRDRRELLRMILAVDTEFNAFMESLGREQNTGRDNRRSLHITPAALQDFGIQGVSGRPSSPTPSHEALNWGFQQSYCWPGTRVHILDDIDHWATTTAGHGSPGPSGTTSPIYWLADIPGSGKSTIAASLTEEWREKGILGGYYDFGMTNHVIPGKNPDSAASGNVPGIGIAPDAVCEAWATQLGAAYPELSSSIIRALSEIHRSSPSSPTRSFANQLKALILDPLKTLHRARHDLQPHTKVLFVLDSIDECPLLHRAAILRAIKSVNPAHGGVKFFLVSGLPTTEAESDIAVELLECSPGLITRGSININSASNMADILLYLTAQFQVHVEQFNNHPQFRSALIEPTIRVLAKRAEGVILWAKLAFEMLLLAENPTRMLLNLVEEDSLTDLNGLYLELLLTTQKNLDELNESRPEGGDVEAFPRNALAVVLSAVGYSMESLSVNAIAELTGLGIERTSTILDLLNIVLDRTEGSRPVSLLPPSSSRTNLAPPPPDSKRRSSSAPRSSPPSSSRQKTSNGPSSAGVGASHKAPQSPLSGGFPSSSHQKTSKRPSSAGGAGGALFKTPQSPSSGTFPGRRSVETRRSRHDAGPSISGTLLAPPSSSSPQTSTFPTSPGLEEEAPTITATTAATAPAGIVRARHATFLQWIRLPHPPTLLSCLTGKGAVEEDDLRFLIAPSREGGHAMLAKGCFGVIRGTTLSPEQVAACGAEPHGEVNPVLDAAAYSCRYWAYHCTEMLSSLTVEHQRSSTYMSIASSGGTRWKGIRGDMLEFFTRKLLWWVDASVALGSAALVGNGLQALQDILKKMSPEEDIKSTVEQLIEWTREATLLLEHPQGLLEAERNEKFLVYKYYEEELSQRAKLAELKLQQTGQNFAREDTEALLPPPRLSHQDAVAPPSPKKTASSGNTSTENVGDTMTAGKAASTSTKTASISTDEERGRARDDRGASAQAAKRELKLSLPASQRYPTVPTSTEQAPRRKPRDVPTPVPRHDQQRSEPPPQKTSTFNSSGTTRTTAPSTSDLFPSLALFQKMGRQPPVTPTTPTSPSTEHFQRPQLVIRKSSSMTASMPTKSIPPIPSPAPVMVPSPTGPPRASLGDVSPTSFYGDIMNMINFDDTSTPLGSSGATGGTGVH